MAVASKGPRIPTKTDAMPIAIEMMSPLERTLFIVVEQDPFVAGGEDRIDMTDKTAAGLLGQSSDNRYGITCLRTGWDDFEPLLEKFEAEI